MRSIKYFLAVIAAALISHVSAEDITTDSAVMKMVIPLYASISELDDFYLTSTDCLLYTSPSPRDEQSSRMPSSA